MEETFDQLRERTTGIARALSETEGRLMRLEGQLRYVQNDLQDQLRELRTRIRALESQEES